MGARTFLEQLRHTVGTLQAAHPEREGELARAHALIKHGMVVPSPDDPTIGQVLASDMQKVYHVNGTCDCQAGGFGKACKHLHAWKLYQYIQAKLDAQASRMPQDATSAPQATVGGHLPRSCPA